MRNLLLILAVFAAFVAPLSSAHADDDAQFACHEESPCSDGKGGDCWCYTEASGPETCFRMPLMCDDYGKRANAAKAAKKAGAKAKTRGAR